MSSRRRYKSARAARKGTYRPECTRSQEMVRAVVNVQPPLEKVISLFRALLGALGKFIGAIEQSERLDEEELRRDRGDCIVIDVLVGLRRIHSQDVTRLGNQSAQRSSGAGKADMLASLYPLNYNPYNVSPSTTDFYALSDTYRFWIMP